MGSNWSKFRFFNLCHMLIYALRYRWHHMHCNIMLFHLLNQLLNFKSCLVIQNEATDSQSSLSSQLLLWGWAILRGFLQVNLKAVTETWWAKQWAIVRHLSLPWKSPETSLHLHARSDWWTTPEYSINQTAYHVFIFISYVIIILTDITKVFQISSDQLFIFIAHTVDLFMKV